MDMRWPTLVSPNDIRHLQRGKSTACGCVYNPQPIWEIYQYPIGIKSIRIWKSLLQSLQNSSKITQQVFFSFFLFLHMCLTLSQIFFDSKDNLWKTIAKLRTLKIFFFLSFFHLKERETSEILKETFCLKHRNNSSTKLWSS